MTFGELKTYEQQLQSTGLEPASINLSLNLPPDLYLLRSTGIDMDLKYRYTMPAIKDSSRMDISLNNQFLQSFSLNSSQDINKLMMRLPVLQGLLDGKNDVSIPALRLGAMNQLRFDFQYSNPMPGGTIDSCVTFQPVQNHVVLAMTRPSISRITITSCRCRTCVRLPTRASRSRGWRISPTRLS